MTPLGPPREVGRRGVRLDVPDDVGVAEAARIEIVAERDLSNLATGRFARPSVGVSWSAAEWPDDIEFCGFAFTQFALPVTGGRELDFDFHPAADLRSPRAVSPLVVRSDASVVLLAPLDAPHEQLVAVGSDSITWGWHGDLDTVPAGFTAALGVYRGPTVAAVLERWASDLTVIERPEPRNPAITHLSYWTDNGAAYWYRTEPGRTISESVVDVVRSLHALDVPIRALELDSWFYHHAVARPIAEIGYPAAVPPTGALTWSARSDAFPPSDRDPIVEFADQLDGLPLILHARHLAPDSPHVDPDTWWVDELAAHPHDPAFFRRWFDDAARWGATCIEQDWMLMYWFGVRALRERPGRAAAWQQALRDHAQSTGLDLIWCMATPADLVFAAGLDRVVAVRTCDDYRFADDPALLWTWFLVVNRLAGALGLTVYKDCFFSNSDVTDDDDPIDGDHHAELEAALSALSGGPVGIGDRIGRTDRDVVMRTCDADGRLRRLDGPIAAADDCLFGGPARGEGLLWATTTSTTADGVWTYVLAINTDVDRRDLTDRFDLPARRDVYDWRAGTTRSAAEITATLSPRDWALFVVPPPGGDISVGQVGKYVVVETDALM